MNDNSKTQQQLIQELAAMRKRVGQMEQSELDRKKAEEALRENEARHRQREERYRNILDNMEEAYYEVDLKGNLTFFNTPAVKNLGYTDNEMMGMNFRQYVDKDSEHKVFEAFHKVFLTGESTKGVDWEFISKAGEKKPIESSVSLIRDTQGNPIGFRGIIRDITERKQIEEKLRREEQRFRAFMEHSSDIVVILNREGTITYINPAVERILGFKIEERIGASGFERVHPDDMKSLADAFNTLARDTNTPILQSEMHLRHKDGSWRTFEAVGSNLVNNNVVEAVIVNYRDITERKRVEDALRKSEQMYLELSIIDDLTQLYNSRHFYSQLKKEIERSNRYEHPLTILLLDLDKFKAFNDTYGHVEGNNVLSRLGQVVKQCLRKTDSAYRYGGEEFTIILPMTTGDEGVVTAKRIQAELRKEAFSPALGQEVYMTVSIGLSQYKPKEEMKVFVDRVDRLMYQAKNSGRDRIFF